MRGILSLASVGRSNRVFWFIGFAWESIGEAAIWVIGALDHANDREFSAINELEQLTNV